MVWYVVDGMDGSGKTTAAYSLKDILEERGRTVRIFNHPDKHSFFGKMAAEFLLKDGKCAMVCATVFFVIDIIGSLFKMKSKRTDDVIFVRYTLSVAYLPENLVSPVYSILSKILPKPDVKIYKDVDVDDALGRIEKRGEKLEMFENREELSKTRRKMLTITHEWDTVNCCLTPDEVSDELVEIINSFDFS